MWRKATLLLQSPLSANSRRLRAEKLTQPNFSVFFFSLCRLGFEFSQYCLAFAHSYWSTHSARADGSLLYVGKDKYENEDLIKYGWYDVVCTRTLADSMSISHAEHAW